MYREGKGRCDIFILLRISHFFSIFSLLGANDNVYSGEELMWLLDAVSPSAYLLSQRQSFFYFAISSAFYFYSQWKDFVIILFNICSIWLFDVSASFYSIFIAGGPTFEAE